MEECRGDSMTVLEISGRDIDIRLGDGDTGSGRERGEMVEDEFGPVCAKLPVGEAGGGGEILLSLFGLRIALRRGFFSTESKLRADDEEAERLGRLNRFWEIDVSIKGGAGFVAGGGWWTRSGKPANAFPGARTTSNFDEGSSC